MWNFKLPFSRHEKLVPEQCLKILFSERIHKSYRQRLSIYKIINLSNQSWISKVNNFQFKIKQKVRCNLTFTIWYCFMYRLTVSLWKFHSIGSSFKWNKYRVECQHLLFNGKCHLLSNTMDSFVERILFNWIKSKML